MTDAGVELPPLGKISLIGIWIESALYGANCVAYGLCMFALLHRGKTAALRWVLVAATTILFLLCTVHVGASLQQLLEAFVHVPADVPNYSTTYWLDYTTTLRRLKDNLYDTLNIALDLILIWRLYVVFMYNWNAIIAPAILAAGAGGLAYASGAESALPNRGIYGSETTSLITAAWVLGFVLNVSVTGAIAIRLWWIGRTVASLTATSTNRFASSIYIIVESGSTAVVCGVVVLALFVSNSPASLAALDVICQLAVLASLLIVVQAWYGRYHVSEVDSSKRITQDEIRVVVSPEQDLVQVLSPHGSESRPE